MPTTGKNQISLYFHIPFCTKKCPYCHFYVIPNKKSFHPLLAEGLEREWELRKEALFEKTVVSIYFGGGTPSLFGPQEVSRILERINHLSSDCEITIETNPEEATFSLLKEYRALGINRLSLGVQSLDDRSLQTLDRIHDAKKAVDAIFSAEKAGFKNISIDLMYDLPGQTESSFRYTLDQIPSLPITHLSLYNLTIEPHTSFYRKKESLVKQIPSGNVSLQLLQMAIQNLEKAGLPRYEISAFGHPSIHNSGYWTARPFLGFGPSAFSFWQNSRFRNIPNLQRYVRMVKNGKLPVDFEETLPYPANIKERLAVQLRLKEGVDTSSWNLPKDTFETLEGLKKEGFLENNHCLWRLTDKGMLFYDTVATEII